MAKTKAIEETTEEEVPQKDFVFDMGAKLRNRHLNETGLVVVRAENATGDWYGMTTVAGMSIGWWHETDIDAAPRTAPPQTKSKQ